MYEAIQNVPGYLPMADEPAIFETADEAWQYLASELERYEDYAYEPMDPADPEGPSQCTETLLALQQYVSSHVVPTGTVYGPTPGYDGDHDLGMAYSVVWTDEEPSDD